MGPSSGLSPRGCKSPAPVWNTDKRLHLKKTRERERERERTADDFAVEGDVDEKRAALRRSEVDAEDARTERADVVVDRRACRVRDRHFQVAVTGRGRVNCSPAHWQTQIHQHRSVAAGREGERG